MSLLANLFGSSSPAPAAPAAPANAAGTPGNIPPNTPVTGQAGNGAAPNGTIPQGTDTSNTPAATPLDQFADLWKNEPTDPNAQVQAGVFGNVDPKKFMEAAGKIDFAKVVTPDQLTAIGQGGEAAVTAFASAMNSVAQSVYAQSAFATTKLVDQALAKAKDGFMADLPQHIKRQTVTDNLRIENPIFSNPAVQPIISALEQQMTVKFPNATAPEITAMAKQYVEALGTSLAPKPVSTQTKGGVKADEDWSGFLS